MTPHRLARCRPRDPHRRLRQLEPKIRAVAHRVWRQTGSHLEREELAAVGWAAVGQILREHDEDRAPFDQHLCLRARWAMIDYARRQRRTVNLARGYPAFAAQRHGDGGRRVGGHDRDDPKAHSAIDGGERAGRIEAGPEATALALSEEESPEITTMRRERALIVREAVALLPPLHRCVVERHYFAGDKFKCIADDLKMSTFATCRVHRQAIDRLQRSLQAVEPAA
jgi:RNA polymerase sigma factor (sigma-70 family)